MPKADGLEPDPIAAFYDDADRLDQEAFGKKYGPAFLVLHTADFAEPRPMQRTHHGRSPFEEKTGETKLLVFPIRKTSRNNTFRYVTVGRTENNDIVIPDISVSKFHAYFQPDDDGHMSVLDAGSTNGTRVDKRPVPARGDGDAMLLGVSANIEFGSVMTTYLELEQFIEFARAMGS